MSPVPIYSRKLWGVQNSSGTLTLNNPGPDHYVIMTVTVFWGGLSLATFSLVDQSSAVMLRASLDPTGQINAVWTDLRIQWAAGEDIALVTDFGLDLTGHGYQLTPP